MTNEMKIASIYAKFSGDATPTVEEMYPFLEMAETFGSAAATASIIQDGPVGSVLFGDALSNADKVATVFNALFGRAPLTAGTDYWVDQLENNSAYVNETSMAEAILRGSEANADQTDWLYVEGYASTLATDLAAYVPTTNPVNPGEDEGQDFYLTSGTDRSDRDDDMMGTDDQDTFYADIAQNSVAGGVSNTLSSADHLDGGDSTDTLHAELIGEFVGSDSGENNDATPHTTSIEVVTINAIDDDTTTTLDAKNMTNLDKIGSYMSDGDLVIENLTTLTDEGTIRHTSDMTITMDHTDSMNSDEDASDLTVYFDEDYLNRTTEIEGSSLTINMINTLNLELNNGTSFIEGFDTLTFSVDDTLITVNVAGAELSAVQGLIAVALADAGFADINVATYTEDAYFGTNIYYEDTDTTYNAGDYVGTYSAFILTNSGSEELTEGGFTLTDGQNDGSLAYSQNDTEAETVDLPISIEVELEKVGRDGDGGNLVIGGKDQDSIDSDEDQNDGIEQFDITVLGDEDKPSNLGTIMSTNDFLDTVNISSETRTDGSYASLTVRGITTDGISLFNVAPFGGTLDTLNANAFMGDLTIGSNSAAAAEDIETFTATGGGDVELWSEYGQAGGEAGATGAGLASLDNNAFTITTANGADTINANIDGGAQVTITTGSADDSITASIDGTDDSGSTESKAIINSTSGNNTVTVSGTIGHEAEITLGGGADTVNGGVIDIDAETGAGNDTIYTNNTAVKAKIVNTVTDNTIEGTPTSIAGTTGAPATPDQSELLYGRSVVVTLATEGIAADEFVQGYESISVDIVASNGYLTTATDLHTAIAKAINNDPVLSKLAEATVDSNGTLTVQYLIDGEVDVSANAALEYTLSGDYSDLGTSEKAGLLAQLEVDYTNSDLVEANLTTAYDTVAITAPQAILDNGTGTDGVDSAIANNNVVNGGLGDDVIVLSTNDGATDTVMIDANGFGDDTIVHFEVGLTGDVIDFAHLDNVTSLSGSSVSEIDIVGTIGTQLGANANTVVDVTLADLTDNSAAASVAMTFDTLTSSGVLAEINAAQFGVGAQPAGFAGVEVNSIFMVEDNANDGFYKVFEVVYNTTDAAFTEATLVGSVDFEATVTLVDANIA